MPAEVKSTGSPGGVTSGLPAMTRCPRRSKNSVKAETMCGVSMTVPLGVRAAPEAAAARPGPARAESWRRQRTVPGRQQDGEGQAAATGEQVARAAAVVHQRVHRQLIFTPSLYPGSGRRAQAN